jgi:hypothetical protein
LEQEEQQVLQEIIKEQLDQIQYLQTHHHQLHQQVVVEVDLEMVV